MSTKHADRPSAPAVQTYRRDAEKLAARVAQPNSDPKLVSELAEAIRRQSAEISESILRKARLPRV